MVERKSKRTVHTYLAEMAEVNKERSKVTPDTGSFVRVAEACRCVSRNCAAPSIRSGCECYMHADGSVECLNCHPRGLRVVNVVDRECKVCGSRFQFLGDDDEDQTGLTCSPKCRRMLDRRNEKSAKRADVA